MVAGEHEDGVVEPRLTTGFFEEPSNSHIGIADALVDDDALFGITLLVLLWDGVGVMTAGCEDGCHEGLFHLRHFCGVVLQEGFVPDGPHAVEIGIATKARIAIVVLTTIIVLESCGP